MDFGFWEVLGFGLEVVGVWLDVRVGWCIWRSAQRCLSVGGMCLALIRARSWPVTRCALMNMPSMRDLEISWPCALCIRVYSRVLGWRWRKVSTSWRLASRLANALRALGRGDSGVPDAE